MIWDGNQYLNQSHLWTRLLEMPYRGRTVDYVWKISGKQVRLLLPQYRILDHHTSYIVADINIIESQS